MRKAFHPSISRRSAGGGAERICSTFVKCKGLLSDAWFKHAQCRVSIWIKLQTTSMRSTLSSRLSICVSASRGSLSCRLHRAPRGGGRSRSALSACSHSSVVLTLNIELDPTPYYFLSIFPLEKWLRKIRVREDSLSSNLLLTLVAVGN